MTGWISIKTRRPADNVPVFIYNGDVVSIGWCFHGFDLETEVELWVDIACDLESCGHISHWMPIELPEAQGCKDG